MIGLYDNPVDHYGEKVAQIQESVTKQVNKMSLRDVVWEIAELTSNKNLLSKVWGMIEQVWRDQGVNRTIDDMLDELFCTDTDLKNICIFINHLRLEQTIREMMIETYVDREASELE